MKASKILATVSALLWSFSGSILAADLVPVIDAGLRVERGFRIALFADHDLAPDTWCMTLDARGRVVVGNGQSIRTLADDDDDGVADRAVEFARLERGVMGMCFDGTSLYVAADGWLQRYDDADGDSIADTVRSTPCFTAACARTNPPKNNTSTGSAAVFKMSRYEGEVPEAKPRPGHPPGFASSTVCKPMTSKEVANKGSASVTQRHAARTNIPDISAASRCTPSPLKTRNAVSTASVTEMGIRSHDGRAFPRVAGVAAGTFGIGVIKRGQR